MVEAFIEIMQAIFTQNILILLGVIWTVGFSTFIETRFVNPLTAYGSGAATFIFAIGIFSLDFSENSMSQFLVIFSFLVIAGVYIFSAYKDLFDIEDELSLIFAGRQAGAFQE